jgi:acetyl esterase/lipase
MALSARRGAGQHRAMTRSACWVVAMGLLTLPAAGAGEVHPPWAGRWRGFLRTDGGVQPLAALLSTDGDRASGRVAVEMSVPDEMYEVQAVEPGRGVFSVRAKDGDARLTLSGGVDGGVSQGSATRGEAPGQFELHRLADRSHAELDELAGMFRQTGAGADGGFVYVLREYNYLTYLDEDTGETGYLMPTADRSFFVGPSIGADYPPVRTVALSPDAGVPTALTLKDLRSGKTVSARRLDPFALQQVTFLSGDVRLAGELRIPPRSDASLPAVILFQGSNPQTRNGQGGWIGFMANALARSGFVTLTFDKRGIGDSGGAADDGMRVADGLAALAFLRARPEVDPARIGLLGVSQGGSAIAGVAAQGQGIRFLINFSGATVNSNEQEIQRTEQVLRADGFPETDIRKAVALQRLKFDYACTRRGWSQYRAALQAANGARWLPDPYIGPPESQTASAWGFWKCGTNPGDAWSRLGGPAILVLFGEHEALCDPAKNIAAFETFMKKAHNQRYEVLRVPGAEHSMTLAKSGGERDRLRADRYVPSLFKSIPAWAWKQVEAP